MRCKRLLCFGIVAVLAWVGLQEMTAHAAEVQIQEEIQILGDSAETAAEDFRYTGLADGTLEITIYSGSGTEIKIPGEIDGKRVTSIEKEAFYKCSKLKDVYYSESQNQWKKIKIKSGNDELKSASIHYNSSTQGKTQTITAKRKSREIGVKC